MAAQAVGDLEHTLTEQPHDFAALQARFGDRDRLGGQGAAGRVGQGFGPERLFQVVLSLGSRHLRLKNCVVRGY